jgi:hypothetical protein
MREGSAPCIALLQGWRADIFDRCWFLQMPATALPLTTQPCVERHLRSPPHL